MTGQQLDCHKVITLQSCSSTLVDNEGLHRIKCVTMLSLLSQRPKEDPSSLRVPERVPPRHAIIAQPRLSNLELQD